MDPRAGLDDMEKLKLLHPPVLKLRPLGLPARSQSLYRISNVSSVYYFCVVTYSHKLRLNPFLSGCLEFS
jgi:hypothetical protein